MFSHNWIKVPVLIWTLASCFAYSVGQSQNAIGAHRVFQKTSFSCVGRPSGYYADIETGCQVYHMCDGLGRQFSYSCPNTTLFQQRMLICDHWYMVNCSRAESDYAANLLIGQRDKPFVGEEENHLRTPRPDLLDRPYAPDYSGESFRNQYKQLPAIQNQIIDSDQRKDSAKFQPNPPPSQTRWKIPTLSRAIIPPSQSSQARPSTTNQAPTSNPTLLATRPQDTAINSSPSNQHLDEDPSDLGTSHSTRYNTSADFTSDENRKPSKAMRKYSATTTELLKMPSRIYEPPFLHPIYNQDNKPSTETPLHTSTATPFTAPATSSLFKTTTKITTKGRPPSRQTTVAGQPFAPSRFAGVTATASTNTGRDSNSLINQTQRSNYDFSKFLSRNSGNELRTATSARGFKAPQLPKSTKPINPPLNTTTTTQASIESVLDYSVPSANANRLLLPPKIDNSNSKSNSKSNTKSNSNSNSKVDAPAKDLLPPHEDFVMHDTATTQGPPIYYEWKVPSNGLEPPKLDPPIGVDGRTEEESLRYVANADQDRSATTTTSSFVQNSFLNSITSKSQRSVDSSTARTPTSRSIKDTAQPGNLNAPTNGRKKPLPTEQDFQQLRRDYLVPDYLFPLEPVGRTGYEPNPETFNSFQLKIPERSSDQRWYGENPQCPQCHPSYVKPGTCEPCLRR